MSSIAAPDWITSLPKAELHIHLDGSLEAGRMLQLAQKNGVELPYKSVEEVAQAYNFTDLQSFLDLYYMGASVLCDEEDFYHLMMDYLLQCKANNIVHTEIMIEPQTYLPRGIGFEVFMSGFRRAIRDAEDQWGQSVLLILSLLKHTSEEECIQVLEMADAWRDDFVALGMASTELGNPPEKFARLFELGKQRGYELTTHAGEEGPPAFIWGSLQVMNVTRIDHGVRCLEDPTLVDYLREHQIALTVCPLSNIRLCVFNTMADHNIVELMQQGLKVTINSDDPAYFGGYLNDNFCAVAEQFNLSQADVLTLIKNGFEASYLRDERKAYFLEQLSA
ncbi:adenosine deaminase [Teredinibacter turnerae]|uniref:adenosine deaminase n=1 Tax=Teredinibacter turnerae TaxID=2426 RepID=UPI0003714EFD|nr:adenosine deaminase [Teredinibacter turnerae]